MQLPCLYLCISRSCGEWKTTSPPMVLVLLQQVGAAALSCWWYPNSYTLLPHWAAGAGIAGLNDSPAVTLSLLCLMPHHSVPIRIFVYLCQGIWHRVSSILFFFFPPVMSLKSSDCLLCRLHSIMSCECWLLQLCGNALRQHSVAANWFIVMAGKWKVD